MIYDVLNYCVNASEKRRNFNREYEKLCVLGKKGLLFGKNPDV